MAELNEKLAPPRHIAIIMDGNGRWAKKRGLPRTAGHSAGGEAFRRTANYCRTLGVKYLTVYAFSTENWKRSEEEVAGIMKLPEQLVCLGDGMSELVLVKNPAKLSELPLMLESVISQRFDNDNVLVLHTKKAKFSFDKPVSWTRDGEDGGSHSRLELSNIPCPIRLIF